MYFFHHIQNFIISDDFYVYKYSITSRIVMEKGILFVRCYGVINKETKKELEKTLESAINEVGIKYLLLNVENIYYINTEIESIINFA